MTLIFPHIPKTAGLSLYHELASFAQYAIRFGNNEELKHFSELSPSEVQKYWIVSGHLSLPKFRDKNLHGPAFTIIRDPEQRFISMFRYLNRSEHPDHKNLKFSDPDKFIDWLLSEPWYSNEQCRYISNLPKFEPARKILNEENILATPLENFSDLVEYFAHHLHCPLKVQHRNQSPEGDYIKFTQAQRSRLEPLVVEDRKLHKYVLENFNRFKEKFTKMNQETFDLYASMAKRQKLNNNS